MLTDTLTDNATDTTDTDTDKPTDTDTSTNKRVIPRSDDKIVRLDVRFPKPIHDEIEALAIANGSPIHHISKRPTLTPTILDLIRIGLDHYSPEALERIQAKSVSVNRVTDNCIDLEALKAELLDQLRGEIANTQQQLPTLDPDIEKRLDAMESVLAGKYNPSPMN
jgi:hypothetical protein